ncbi:hypothetical protein [Pseudoglutamicibacter cumminsii]|nr:hypothetical protein [Pseudoglutamicibacter cumminsii]MCT1686864.1 hypothetical protein [Pseudoglutamicibacter cumminsii]MDK7083412.1 hypothetical protein [Pseudoglutamicibacter cumminsii]PKY80135.1 hypothetical protein CYJ35_05585 [Pseudoglutamicibacter albus]
MDVNTRFFEITLVLHGHGVVGLSVLGVLAGLDLEVVAQVRPGDLIEADALWLASSVQMLRPVSRVDGTEVSLDPELHEVLSHTLEQTL